MKWQGRAMRFGTPSLPDGADGALTNNPLLDAVCFGWLHPPACAGEVLRLAPVVCGGLRLGERDPTPADCSAGKGRR